MAATSKLLPAEKLEIGARQDLRRAAIRYAAVAADENEDVWTEAWQRLRDAALAYATATHEATRARAKEAK